jgi:hypothetical protein
MKILVFDDSQIHRAAAQAQLTDHDLVVVGTYDAAQKAVTPSFDEEGHSRAVEERVGVVPPRNTPDEEWQTYWAKRRAVDAEKELREQYTTYPDFDVVLVDLLVPASSQAQGNKGHAFVGQEMPIGIFIALLAARNGAKYVAVLTDSSHHDHPASACFDVFNEAEVWPTPFMVEGARVILSNARNWVNRFQPDDLSVQLSYEEAHAGKPNVRAKNWKKLFDYLLDPVGNRMS